MWIKICANTSLGDAGLAAEMGADAVGFVFAPSPRRVTVEQVAAITPELPGEVEKIGVFHQLEFASIVDAVNRAGLTGVQLHGAYNAELARDLKEEFGLRIDILQTLHWWVDRGAEEAEAFEQTVKRIAEDGHVNRILVDARTAEASGGTGRSFDWMAAQSSIHKANGWSNVIVAGGLNPMNVATAIDILRPWGVDVASGVERAPGVKDPMKLAAFIRIARM